MMPSDWRDDRTRARRYREKGGRPSLSSLKGEDGHERLMIDLFGLSADRRAKLKAYILAAYALLEPLVLRRREAPAPPAADSLDGLTLNDFLAGKTLRDSDWVLVPRTTFEQLAALVDDAQAYARETIDSEFVEVDVEHEAVAVFQRTLDVTPFIAGHMLKSWDAAPLCEHEASDPGSPGYGMRTCRERAARICPRCGGCYCGHHLAADGTHCHHCSSDIETLETFASGQGDSNH